MSFSANSQLLEPSQLYNESLTTLAYSGSLSPDPQQYLQSEPLSRYESSEGSCYTSSTPTSPMPNAAFFSFQSSPPPRSSPFPANQDPSTPATSFYNSPDLYCGSEFTNIQELSSTRRISEDSQVGGLSHGGRDYPVCCLFPGCEAKPFKRRADLDRHYKHKHAPESVKESYYCDYPRCGRRNDPFHRRDHFRDHLRDFHKEDIEKRGVAVKEDWFEGRNAAQTWWRCNKCLKRIYINRDGYECPTCRTSLQARRKQIRRRE